MAQKIDGNVILQAVDVVVNKRIEDLDLDKTVIATVDQPLTPARDGSHRIKYAGGYFTAYAPIGTVYTANTTVHVLVPQNNFSNRKTILGPASVYSSGTDIASVSTALNNYVPIGNNVLELIKSDYAETGYGLNSYAQQQDNSDFQETILLYDKTNAEKSQYIVNISDLETYLKKAKAIMLQADFRTTLLDDQQVRPSAEYGLNFDLVFKNQDGVYKTQGALFAAVADNTQAEATNDEGEILYRTMGDFKDDIDNLFDDDSLDITDFQIRIINISQYIEDFLTSTNEQMTSQEKAIFEAFKYIVLEIGTDSTHTLEEIKEKYDSWFAAELGLTEEQRKETKTLTYSLNSSRMIGNPFIFTEFNTQYMIFPIDTENFDHIERIYFYEKGFKVDGTRYDWVDKNRYKMKINDEYHGKDIWVRDLKFYALNEISSEYGDYKFRIDTPQGSIFKPGITDSLTVKAKVLYKEYNSVNDDCSFYWFVKDARVSSSMNPNYEMHGGIGWRYIGSTEIGHVPTITLLEEDYKAYENEFMCAAVYNGAAEGTITLKQYFTLYNEGSKRNISITSSLGERFKFDVGTPIFTCLIDGHEEPFDDYKQDSAFKFVWSRSTQYGQIIPFNRTYEEAKQDRDTYRTIDYNQMIVYETEMNNLRGVDYPKGVNGNQLSYDIRYLGSDSQATFKCQVYTTDSVDAGGAPISDGFGSDYYSIGAAELTISNESLAQLNEYSIVIENGDQVFQYSESGVAPTFAGSITPTDFRHTEPQEIKKLSAHFYTPNGLEVSEGTYTVQWRYPIEETLIVAPAGLLANPATGDLDMVGGQTTEFNIADSFDYNALNNQIQCIITYAGQTYTQYTQFFFGKIGDNGTNGTDIVARIVVANDNAGVIQKYPLTAYIYGDEVTWNIGRTPQLQLKLYNRSTEIVSDYTVYWDILGGINRSNYLTLDVNENTCTLGIDLNQIDKYSNQIIQATARYNGQNYYCNFPIILGFYSGSREQFNKQFNTNKISIDKTTYLQQILYNADGRNPMYNKNQGISLLGVDKRYIHWQVPSTLNNLSASIGLIENRDDIVQLDEIAGYGKDKIYILPNSQYDGTACDNRVEVNIYVSDEDESNLEDYYLRKDYLDNQLNTVLIAKKEEIRQENINHTRILNAADRDYLSEQNRIISSEDSAEDQQAELAQLSIDYEDIVSQENNRHNERLNYLNEEINNLQSVYETDVLDLEEEIGYVEDHMMTFSIPIYMALNTFGLASLNAWDGNHVDINEEGGYIVAPQIGAGEKDNDNKFTGIVMGSMSQYGQEETDIGLLGLSKGRQSIFLDAKTGNAIFGLPEEDKFGSDGTDEYYEGRIELIPGKRSQIGGWRLGRRSLYYAVDENDVIVNDLQNAYADKPRTYEKDIGHEDKGILLTAAPNPYISIKGRKLSVYDPRLAPEGSSPTDYDIDNSSGNAALTDGNSLELQLDPNMPSFFTIYRHYQNGENWGREKLVGIDAMGRFYTNSLQDKETSLNMNYVPGFGQNAADRKYAGLFVGYGNHALFKSFLQIDKINEEDDYLYNISSPIYISGGDILDEAKRPFNVYGKTIGLFAGSIDNEERDSDSKITISSSKGYIGNPTSYLNLDTASNAKLYASKPIIVESGSGVTLKGTTLTETFSSSGSLSFSSTFDLIATNNITLTRNSGHSLSLTNNTTTLGKSSTDYLEIKDTAQSKFQSKGNILINADYQTNVGGELYLYAHSNAASIWRTWNTESANGTYINIMALSGAASTAVVGAANSTNMNAAKGKNEINITTGRSSYYIRSDFGLKPGYTTAETVQASGGWSIQPGISTGWIGATKITASEDVVGGGKSLKSHTHPFSKGVSVHSSSGTDVLNPGVGNNAQIYLGVTASASATVDHSNASASLTITRFDEVPTTLYMKVGNSYGPVNQTCYVKNGTVSGTISNGDNAWFGEAHVSRCSISGATASATATVNHVNKNVTIQGTSASPS